MKESKRKIKLEDVHYYFDGQERDCRDIGSDGSRLHLIAKIRDQLMRISPEEFQKTCPVIMQLLHLDPLAEDVESADGKRSALRRQSDLLTLQKPSQS